MNESENKLVKKDNSISKEKKDKTHVETDEMLQELISKELRSKLSEKISNNDQNVINAIKAMISESK